MREPAMKRAAIPAGNLFDGGLQALAWARKQPGAAVERTIEDGVEVVVNHPKKDSGYLALTVCRTRRK